MAALIKALILDAPLGLTVHHMTALIRIQDFKSSQGCEKATYREEGAAV